MALFCLLFLPLLVPQLSIGLLQAPLGDFPEFSNLVSLQLEETLLLTLSVQLLSEANDVLYQLGGSTHTHKHKQGEFFSAQKYQL